MVLSVVGIVLASMATGSIISSPNIEEYTGHLAIITLVNVYFVYDILEGKGE